MKRITLTLGILGLMAPSTALAGPRAHISTAHAQAFIAKWVGPGTVVTKCRRFAPSLVGCDYETPSTNAGITFEEEATGFKPESGTWHGYVTVRQTHHGLRFIT